MYIVITSKTTGLNSWAYDFAVDLDELQSTLKAEISMAQQNYQKSANAQCFPTSDFKVGDKVAFKEAFWKIFQTLWNHFLA